MVYMFHSEGICSKFGTSNAKWWGNRCQF